MEEIEMGVSVREWGELPDGTTARLYTVEGEKLSFTVSDLGGTITSIIAPDRDGKPGEVCLGYDTVEQYLADNAFVGVMVGRYANRIAGARFTLDGVEYRLTANAGGTHLHGGGSWNKRLWAAECLENGVVLRLTSPDGDDGYPGKLNAQIKITLAGERVEMEFTAVCDRDTYVSLTNHAYFNLRGHGDIYSHEAKVNAGRFTPLNADLVTTGEIVPVEGTVYDYREFKAIDPEVDINYVLEGASPAAEARDPETGRVLRVLTDLPCVQFYAGGMMTPHTGRNGQPYHRGAGFCLEPQYFPNAPNMPNFPGGQLKAGELYRHMIAFEFGVSN
jgi:aldose 1-epimerase